MAKVIAICGKICSGKTYYANTIKDNENAVLLSCDELTKALFHNDLGEKHDEMTLRIRSYLQNKSLEFVSAGCTVILDWGFWTRASREQLTAFYKAHNIPCQWHYIDIDDAIWQKNIDRRNRQISQNAGSSDYYLDEGLINKLLSKWEAPAKEEIDCWVKRT